MTADDFASSRSIEPASLDGISEALTGLARTVNWDEQREPVRDVILQFWRNQQWATEPDQFALSVSLDVAAVPPWQIQRRIDVLVKHVAARYDLSSSDAAWLQVSVSRSAGELLARHAPLMIKHMQAFFKARQSEGGISADLARQWSMEVDPIVQDFDRTLHQLCAELKRRVPAEKQPRLSRDFAAHLSRRQAIDVMLHRWQSGQWAPRDWGLEPTPWSTMEQTAPRIGKRITDSAARPLGATAVSNTKWVDHDPGTWKHYLDAFAASYRLDRGQQDAAASIHEEVFSRAKAYIDARRTELAKISYKDRAEDAAYEPVRTVFSEFRDRLNALPSSGQRIAALKSLENGDLRP